jgi:hypothetical protein
MGRLIRSDSRVDKAGVAVDTLDTHAAVTDVALTSLVTGEQPDAVASSLPLKRLKRLLTAAVCVILVLVTLLCVKRGDTIIYASVASATLLRSTAAAISSSTTVAPRRTTAAVTRAEVRMTRFPHVTHNECLRVYASGEEDFLYRHLLAAVPCVDFVASGKLTRNRAEFPADAGRPWPLPPASPGVTHLLIPIAYRAKVSRPDTYTAFVAEARALGYTRVGAYIRSDEKCRMGGVYRDTFDFIVRAYNCDNAIAAWAPHILIVPLGQMTSGSLAKPITTYSAPRNSLPASSRRRFGFYLYANKGSSGKGSSRTVAVWALTPYVKRMEERANITSQIHLYHGFAHGAMKKQTNSSTGNALRLNFIESKFCPSPYGGSPETFRHWEILASGCIPIMQVSDTYKGMFADKSNQPPWLFVDNSWRTGGPFQLKHFFAKDDLLFNGTAQDALQQRTLDWYDRHLHRIAVAFEKLIFCDSQYGFDVKAAAAGVKQTFTWEMF